MSGKKQTIELQPDWRRFLIPFVIGVLTIPLLGVGIWIIVTYRNKLQKIRYNITNSGIILRDDDGETKIRLLDIISCEVTYPRFMQKFGLGDIRIQHKNGTTVLLGVEDSEPVSKLLIRAAESERDRMQLREEVAQTTPPHPTGTLEKKNELVGLWQQGLISEEDYHNELKKFE